MEQDEILESEKTLQAHFERFDQAHPEVYQEFKKVALDLFLRGRKHYGAKAIMEVIRYHRAVSGQDSDEPFKCNNNYPSRMARKLIDEDSRFADFFETRELRRT